jgi:hypothetical protein
MASKPKFSEQEIVYAMKQAEEGVPVEELPTRLSQKEFAKKARHEAYLRAKEYRKTDPRQIAMKAKLKQQRRDAYQKAKARAKERKAERKEASDEKAADVRVAEAKNVMTMLVPASTLEPGSKRRS